MEFQPTAKAFRFVIDGQNQQYDAYIDLIDGIDNIRKEMMCRYRAQSDTSAPWVFLSSLTVYDSHVVNGEAVDARLDSCITELNAKIAEVFGTAGDIPLKGWERFAWQLQVGIEESNNIISRI